MILERMFLRPSRKRAPCAAAFSIIPSSTSTRRAARATAQASGLPPKAEPGLDLVEDQHHVRRLRRRDAAAMTQDGHPVPGVAQAAIQQGRFVGR